MHLFIWQNTDILAWMAAKRPKIIGLQKSLGKWINFLLDLFPSAFVVSVFSFKPYWTKNYAHLLNHGLTSSKVNNKAGYTLGHGCVLLLGPCAFFQFKNEEKAAAKVLKWGFRTIIRTQESASDWAFKTSAISDIQNTYLVGPWSSTQ